MQLRRNITVDFFPLIDLAAYGFLWVHGIRGIHESRDFERVFRLSPSIQAKSINLLNFVLCCTMLHLARPSPLQLE